MRLSHDIDFRQITKDAELKPYEAECFEKSLKGKLTDPVSLLLKREPYTQLQKALEEVIMEILSSQPELVFAEREDVLRPPFAYRTPALCTPVHDPKHPRAEVMERMLAGPDPFAALVCNTQGLEGMRGMEHLKDAQVRERLERLLTGTNRAVDPFSVNPTVSRPHSYMAMRPFGGLNAVQFKAAQTSNKPGEIIFGEEALAAYERTLVRHHINRVQGRTSELIMGVLLE